MFSFSRFLIPCTVVLSFLLAPAYASAQQVPHDHL